MKVKNFINSNRDGKIYFRVVSEQTLLYTTVPDDYKPSGPNIIPDVVMEMTITSWTAARATYDHAPVVTIRV